MFTGIIEEVGRVIEIRKGSAGVGMTIAAPGVLEGTRIGDSINTNGVCLTVTSLSAASFTVDVMPETMRRSSLGNLRPGSFVNLERALRLSDRLGGHLVSGHIDATGRIAGVRKEDNATWIKIEAPSEVMRYLVDKGSVAIDGISLTVVKPAGTFFEVSVIPHTRSETTIHDKKAGDRVNIECDLIGKYVERLAGGKIRPIDRNLLLENGFLD